MNNDGPPSRPSCAHCPPEPLRTVALSLPHSAHHPTPPHDTAAVRQGQRARGRRRKERERGGARSTQQHRTVHTPTTPHTPPASLLKRAQEPRHDSAKMVQQCHKWSNATHGDEKHNTREASTSKRRNAPFAEHVTRAHPSAHPCERHHHQHHRCAIAALHATHSHTHPKSENKRHT